MKRDRNTFVYNETGIYKVNQVTESYFNKCYEQQTGPYVQALHQSSYQICNVYTDKGSAISAYQKLNGNQATNQVFLDHNNSYIPIEYRSKIRSEISWNDHFNCHGFTFLDAQFWLELNNETVDLIIEEDNYESSSLDQLVNNGISLFYNSEGFLIHSARMVNGNLLSKFGINHIVTIGLEDILDRYKNIDHSRTRYFNKAF